MTNLRLTDCEEFINDIDGGAFAQQLGNSVSKVANAAVDTQKEGLISVMEALRAMACGRLVQCTSQDFPNWTDLEITNINAKNFIDEERINKNGFKYRYKPSLISVNPELTQMKKPQ